MNGKLYSHNLVAIANFDGADASIGMTENQILVRWANALTGDSLNGLSDYRLWNIILMAMGGEDMSGAPLQRIVLAVVEIITGEEQDSALNIYELVSIAADSDGPTPPVQCFTLIGSTECFTLIGSAEAFDLIQ